MKYFFKNLVALQNIIFKLRFLNPNLQHTKLEVIKSKEIGSCVRSSAKVGLFVHLIIPCFHLPLDVFSFALQIRLSLPHPLTLGLTHNIYGQLLNPMGIHLLHFAHGGERTTSHDAIQDRMFFCHLLFNLLIHELVLFCQLMAFTHWLMSLPIGITSGFFLWGGCNINGSGRKDLIVIITQ